MTAEGHKLSGVRAVIARRMSASLAEAAQLTYFADADVTALLQARQTWKTGGVRISIEDCAIHALAQALTRFPEFNALVEEDRIFRGAAIDVAVAISTPNGLMTPVLRGVERLGLADIAGLRRDLVDRALGGRLKVSELKGGTVTVSNLGLTRVNHFTPILNRPQVALLGLGRIEPCARPAGHDGIVWRNLIGLSLTVDHRVLDGEPSGRFLGEVCALLEHVPDAL